MAKTSKSKAGAGARAGGRGFLSLLWSTPVRLGLLLILILGLLLAWSPAISSFGNQSWLSLLRAFGIGALLFILIALGLVWLLWRWRWEDLKLGMHYLIHWNYRWLGILALGAVILGILALFYVEGASWYNLGGEVGRWIAGGDLSWGVARLLVLALLGCLFLAPRQTVRFIGAAMATLGKIILLLGKGVLQAAKGLYVGAVLGVRWLARAYSRHPLHQVIASWFRKSEAQPEAMVPDPLPVPETSPAAPVAAAPPAPPPEAEGRAKLGFLHRDRKPATPSAPPAPAPSPDSRPRLEKATQQLWQKYVAMVPSNNSGWQLPSIDILDRGGQMEWSDADNEKRARHIEETLGSYGVEAKVVQINKGPTVTQFGVEPGWDHKYKDMKEKDEEGNVNVRREEVSRTRVKVERITGLANDLAMALAVPSIRIEAPVPGKPMVGIEVPNTKSAMVTLRDVIETPVFQKALSKSRLTLGLGRGTGGDGVAGDLSKMPHLLIAGATGSGKTVCLNAIVSCLLLHNTPDALKLLMIDPKRVEMVAYNGIPHLACPVVVDTKKAVAALHWLSGEMDRRYETLAAAGARNIEGYNGSRSNTRLMPYIVVVVDELADLMMTSFDEVETVICRLAQLARATGIHLVVATQRPSVDVVTGLIKANFPTRISFAVTSQVDSRTILDTVGAEQLLGKGDMLYLPTDAAKPKRLQGCLLSDEEIERLVYFWGSQSKDKPPQMCMVEGAASPGEAKAAAGEPGELRVEPKADKPADAFLEDARRLAQEHKHISTSFLQRRLNIGYPRAARIMDMLIEEGIVAREEKPPEAGEGSEAK